MKNYYNVIPTVLLVIIGLLIIRQCPFPFFKQDNTPGEGAVIVKIETKWDTVSIEKPVYIPKYITKTVIEFDTITLNIDTLSILREYYTKYFYSDTISLDPFGSIVINDTIYKNSIFSRQIYPTLYIPITTINRDSLISKNEYYLGIGTHISPGEINYIGGEFLFRSKSKKVFGVGLGINQQLNPVIGGRIYWSIK